MIEASTFSKKFTQENEYWKSEFFPPTETEKSKKEVYFILGMYGHDDIDYNVIQQLTIRSGTRKTKEFCVVGL